MRKKRTGTDRCSFSFICFGSKKGQITIFIILGILLLLGLVLVLTLKSEVITFNPDEVILTEKGKIETFILSCIKEVGEEAVFLVGLQGGYIEAPQTALSLPVSPAHSIPYWAYGETTNIPTLEQIKQRIDTYVVDNLRSCILNLEPFQITYDITEKSPLTVETDITEQKILYNVHWDLEVQDKAGRVVAEVLNHVTESPIKLKRLYDVATLLVDKEMAELKLEDITQDLIAIGHEDVPVAGFEVSCKKRKWSVQQAELSLQDLLRINLGQLQVKNSAFAEFSDQYPYYQSHYQWNLGQDFSQPDVSVAFNFDNTYPFTFNVRPTSGDKMTSNQLGGGHELIDFLCLQNWKFVYDISYPVMIDLRDDTTNYRFKIALTVHLANNLPDRSGALLPQPQYEVDSFTDDEFCADRRIPMTAYTYELIENPYTGVYVREPLDNVALAFSCLRYSCDVGDTDLSTGLDNVATLRTNFPYCAGGILRGEKEGYKDGWERVFTGPDKNVEVDLVPLLEIPLDRITVLKPST
jgi:hypothetical protein